jgi:aspartate/methionine/tyrosine aminotransferase
VGVAAIDRLWAGVGLSSLGRWVSGYPGTQGTTGLAAAFPGLRCAERGEDVAPDCFVATHGAFDAVRHALTLLPASSPVAYAAPGFVMDIAVRRAGHQPVAVPWMLPEPVSVWLDRVEDELVRAGRPCGLVVNFPSNPAGSVAGRRDWERLLGLVDRYEALLVVDDVYGFLDPTTRPDLSGGATSSSRTRCPSGSARRDFAWGT